MRSSLVVAMLFLICPQLFAQAALQPQGTTPPSLQDVRKEMAIPSQSLNLRGQLDTTGYASRPEQMEKVWELSAKTVPPDSLGPSPAPGVAAVICPHDDFINAGRVYRKVLPLITARTVVLVGVFHRYRRFAEHDRLVFDPYKAWRTPDGPVPVSNLREDVLGQLPREDFVQDAAMHDSEHSLEALVIWLKHIRPDVEIVPIIVPAAKFDRFQKLANDLGGALINAMNARGWTLGRDVAIAISADGVHYGTDFNHVPYGDGGIDAYKKAVANDMSILKSRLKGPLRAEKVCDLFATFVNPDSPDDYRLTWCGRFSIPFGLLLLQRVARDTGIPTAYPIAYSTSVGWPELPLRDFGLGPTSPVNLYHFVSYPAVAFTAR
jgi:AmmeMemoRadiSam system protein B